jgi:hypothetical protein
VERGGTSVGPRPLLSANTTTATPGGATACFTAAWRDEEVAAGGPWWGDGWMDVWRVG